MGFKINGVEFMLGRDSMSEQTVIIVRSVKALLSRYVLNWGWKEDGKSLVG